MLPCSKRNFISFVNLVAQQVKAGQPVLRHGSRWGLATDLFFSRFARWTAADVADRATVIGGCSPIEAELRDAALGCVSEFGGGLAALSTLRNLFSGVELR